MLNVSEVHLFVGVSIIRAAVANDHFQANRAACCNVGRRCFKGFRVWSLGPPKVGKMMAPKPITMVQKALIL